MTAYCHERSECAYKKFERGECRMDRKFDLRDNAFVTDICKLNIDYESAQSPGSLPVWRMARKFDLRDRVLVSGIYNTQP
jgi:hypothetical protein